METTTDLTGDASFSLFCNRIASPSLRAIADHWLVARGDKRLPSWSDINPSAMAPHFTKISAFNYDRARDEFFARLAGNRIMLAFGKSFRGTPLKDLHPTDIYEKCHANQKRIVTEPAAYRGSGKLFKAGGSDRQRRTNRPSIGFRWPSRRRHLGSRRI